MPSCNMAGITQRTFSSAPPRLWNGLLEEIRQLDSLLAFKKAIKAELFRQAYPVEFVLGMLLGCFKDVLIMYTMFLNSFMCFIFVVPCLDPSGEVGKK